MDVVPHVRAGFSLVDHFGRRRTEADFRGRFMLVYFGFTNCRFVCPSTLTKLSAALERLGPACDRVAPLYVSVDPQRDTPSVMKAYLEDRYPRFLGLTGTADELASAARNYRVFTRRKDDVAENDGYAMPHTALTYLIGPDGDYRAHFMEHVDGATIARRLAAYLHASNP